MCGIVGILGRSAVAMQVIDALKRWSTAATIRPASPRWRTAVSSAAAPRASCATSRRELSQAAADGLDRHRPHALGDAWQAHRDQRPSPRDRQARRGPQRHHREFPRAARRARRPTGVALRDRDRHRGRRPSRHPRAATRRTTRRRRSRRRCPGCAAPSPSPSCSTGEDDLLIGARHGAPLAVGYGDGEMYLGSDALALAPFTDTITYLEDGDWVVLSPRRRRYPRRGRTAGRAAPEQKIAGRRLPGRQGQLPPLHGQGDPRAAGGRRPHAGPLSRHGGRTRAPALRLPFDFDDARPHDRSRPAAPPIMPG